MSMLETIKEVPIFHFHSQIVYLLIIVTSTMIWPCDDAIFHFGQSLRFSFAFDWVNCPLPPFSFIFGGL